MWFFALIVVLLIGAVAVVASGRWGAMADAYDDRPDTLVPARHALAADDIRSARFAVGVRGYRMDEVDTLLERVASEVAERDRRIADLERAVGPIVQGPEGAGLTPRDQYPAAESPGSSPATTSTDAPPSTGSTSVGTPPSTASASTDAPPSTGSTSVGTPPSTASASAAVPPDAVRPDATPSGQATSGQAALGQATLGQGGKQAG
jgi:DivIVA domain-containing protein